MCPRSENVSTGIWTWFQTLFSFCGQSNLSACPPRSIMCVNEALKPGISLRFVYYLLVISLLSLPQLLVCSKIEKETWRHVLQPASIGRQDQRQSASTVRRDAASPGDSPRLFLKVPLCKSNFSLVVYSTGLFEQRLEAVNLLKTLQVTWSSCCQALLAFFQNW